MTKASKFLGLIAGATLAGTVGASAATLDFTAGANQVSSGTFLGVTWTLTATGGAISFNNPYDAVPDPVGTGLALEYDGIGVGKRNDEISVIETLTITFSQKVVITGLHFLDLFKKSNATDCAVTPATCESAIASADTGSLGEHFGVYVTGDTGGYLGVKAGPLSVKSITFSVGAGSDDSIRDYALAAIDIKSRDGQTPSPIPLPAGGALLLGALGGLAMLRRRKA